MSQNDTLNRKQNKAIAALLVNTTVKESAQAAGVGHSTLKRWLTEPDFKAELKRVQSDRLERASARLAGELPAAIATLSEIHQDTEAPASARVRAAALILDYYMRYADAYDLQERVEAIERALGGTVS